MLDFEPNLGWPDRILRLVAGVILLAALLLDWVNGLWAVVLGVLGSALLMEGALAY